MEDSVKNSISTPKALWLLLPGWLRGLIRTMRLKQWTKNGFVFIPIFFDRQISHLDPLLRVLAAFVLFCIMSSAVYVLNDIVDVERDKQHPRKKHRPIASGLLPIPVAKVAAIALPVFSLGGALLFSPPLAIVLGLYYAKDLLYSFSLKNVVIVDVMVLASGFILRVVAGVVVINVTRFSPWLYVIIGMLALFLAVGKRRQELILLAERAHSHRATYKEYNLPLLDDMLRMVTTSVILTYTFYTFESQTALGGQWMLLTVPIAIYGIFRYLYLIHVKGEGGAPDEIVFKDRPLLISAIVFALMVGFVIYILPRILA